MWPNPSFQGTLRDKAAQRPLDLNVGALHPCGISLSVIAGFLEALSPARVPAGRRIANADFPCRLHGRATFSRGPLLPSGRVSRSVAVAVFLLFIALPRGARAGAVPVG